MERCLKNSKKVFFTLFVKKMWWSRIDGKCLRDATLPGALKGALRQHAWPKVPLFMLARIFLFHGVTDLLTTYGIIHGYVRSIQLMLREWPENTKSVVPSCDILQREHCIYAPHVLKKHMFCEYNRVEYGSAAQQRRRQKYFRWKRIQRKEKSADWEEEQASSKACELWGP